MYRASVTVTDVYGGQTTSDEFVAVTESLWRVILGQTPPTATTGSKIHVGIDEGNALQDVHYAWTFIRTGESGSRVVLTDEGFWSRFTPVEPGIYQVILHAYDHTGYRGVMDAALISVLDPPATT
jgi:hypothetical protein